MDLDAAQYRGQHLCDFVRDELASTICSLRRDLKTALHSQGREAVRFDSAIVHKS
jgi:hypothetical protein